ncbi:MAG: amino acid permease [Candidatus Eremiobacteraeota bacterium]|nr:amino acid permease [Candidatus Eremiobacteraeota bacterium]
MLLRRIKSLDHILAEADNKDRGLRRTLGPVALTAMGIGTIIGTGIFVLTGIAAATKAGPALTLSFVVAGTVSALAALCYAELASSVPISGSAYTYAYATLGELIAWIIGWDLVLEYGVGAATVSIGWSGYLANFLESAFGINIPVRFQHAPYDLGSAGQVIHGFANLPAACIILLITLLLIKGTRESSIVNTVIVIIKLSVVLFFLAIGVGHVNQVNWHPYFPFGWSGVFAGAAFIFFAYIGFDSISTAAEEAKNPQRDLPIGILFSLALCTVLYIAVVAVLTGITKYTHLSVPSPVSYAIISLGHLNWAGAIISVGAICGLTTVLLTLMYGQSRILYAMSRDGLLPRGFAALHPVWRTPFVSTLTIGIVFAVIAAFTPIGIVTELTNIGTLAAFILTAIAVVILRRTYPAMRRGFRVPFSPAVPVLSALASFFLITQLRPFTWISFVIWLIIGLVLYAAYGRSHSAVALQERAAGAGSTRGS